MLTNWSRAAPAAASERRSWLRSLPGRGACAWRRSGPALGEARRGAPVRLRRARAPRAAGARPPARRRRGRRARRSGRRAPGARASSQSMKTSRTPGAQVQRDRRDAARPGLAGARARSRATGCRVVVDPRHQRRDRARSSGCPPRSSSATASSRAPRVRRVRLGRPPRALVERRHRQRGAEQPLGGELGEQRQVAQHAAATSSAPSTACGCSSSASQIPGISR